MSRIDLVAVDLDGTLLSKDWQISPRTEEAIRAARRQGVQVTLATGRMFASAVRYARQLDLDLPLITYHGALVRTPSNEEAIYERLLPEKYARAILSLVKEFGYPVNLYFDDQLYTDRVSEATRRYVNQSRVPLRTVSDLRALLDRDPIKLVVINEEKALDTLAEECRLRWGDAVYITKSEPIYLEFMHLEATKGQALAALARHLGIPRERVMAIGDSYNDLEMFKYAGFSVAMGNARDEIKAAADFVTASNEGDGVAAVLERFVLHNSG